MVRKKLISAIKFPPVVFLLIIVAGFISVQGYLIYAGDVENRITEIEEVLGDQIAEPPLPELPALELGTLEVDVKDNTNRPIKDATVILQGSTNGTGRTNEDGVVKFTVLPGNYTVRVAKEGFYLPIKQQEASVKKGEDNIITVSLSPVREFVLIGKMWNFNGSNPMISVDKGDFVRIKFSIEQNDISHTLVIGRENEILAESKTIFPGETAVLEFFADKEGKFFYYCGIVDIYDHRHLGMEGAFEVEG